MSYAYLFKYIIIGDTGKCLYFIAVVWAERGCIFPRDRAVVLLFVLNITWYNARSPTAMVRLETLLYLH